MPHGSTCYSGTKIMEKFDSAKASPQITQIDTDFIY